LPKWEKSKVCVYPMVWTNPKTKEKSLQVHGQGAYKLYLKNRPNGEEKVVEDLKEVRAFMDKYAVRRPVLSLILTRSQDHAACVATGKYLCASAQRARCHLMV
jgi:hypothetical protein